MTSRLLKVFAILATLLPTGAVVLLRADDNPRTPISREWILGAIDSSGIQIAPGQLEQLSSVTAAVPNPRLKVLSVEVLNGESDICSIRAAAWKAHAARSAAGGRMGPQRQGCGPRI